MTNWVCNQDGVVFPVGSARCPESSCQARDAHEQGGDESINVYAAVEATGIRDPGAAWDAVNAAVASVVHEHRQEADRVPSATEGVAAILEGAGEGEVAERLGLLPDDPGASDASTDPAPVTGDNPDSLEGTGDDAGSASARKPKVKDVPS